MDRRKRRCENVYRDEFKSCVEKFCKLTFECTVNSVGAVQNLGKVGELPAVGHVFGHHFSGSKQVVFEITDHGFQRNVPAKLYVSGRGCIARLNGGQSH